MSNFHSRSNSLPSKSHPVMDEVENLVCRLKSSEASLMSSGSLCSSLANLRHLHENISTMIQLPSVQQALSLGQGKNWINELLEASLGLIDLCGFSRDVIYSIKESVQVVGSSIRRNRGESSTSDEIKAYAASRKKIIKEVKKCIKNLKCSNQKSTTSLQQNENDLKSVSTMLKETQALDFSILRSVLMLVSGEKERSTRRSLPIFSKFSLSSRIHSDIHEESGCEDLCLLNIVKPRKNMDRMNVLKQLQSSEMIIQEMEEELEALFKSLVKTRVSLLNLLSH